MNKHDEKYTRFALCREMMETVRVVREFDAGRTKNLAQRVAGLGKVLFTGEGSSRILPAKNAIRKNLTWGAGLCALTDGSRQAATYKLDDFAVFCASNSGRTKEVVELARRLREAGHEHVYGLTANEGTPLSEQAAETFVLTCGWEQAVAATKSVVEQMLLYQTLIAQVAGRDPAEDLAGAAEKVEAALTMPIPPQIVQAAAGAGTLYFAGYNDGVAEELTLKANEITRTKSDFLEGTYAVHGIEEVMDASDLVFVIEPFRAELGKLREVLADGVGLQVVAIDTQPTDFPTLQVPDAGALNPLVFLAAGWNLLVEIGLTRGIDLDKPQRARKVGNELQQEPGAGNQ